MDIKHIIHSKVFKISVIVLAECIFAFVLFSAGMLVGIHKMRFMGHWYEGYQKNFMNPRGGRFGERNFGGDMSGHSVAGNILSIEIATSASSTPGLLIKSLDGVEKNVLVSTSTAVRKYRDEISVNDLKPGDSVVIIGTPNEQGQIVASLIRIMEGKHK